MKVSEFVKCVFEFDLKYKIAIIKKKMISKLLNLKPFKDCETIFFDDKPKNLQALENLIDFNLNARAINEIGAVPVEWGQS